MAKKNLFIRVDLRAKKFNKNSKIEVVIKCRNFSTSLCLNTPNEYLGAIFKHLGGIDRSNHIRGAQGQVVKKKILDQATVDTLKSETLYYDACKTSKEVILKNSYNINLDPISKQIYEQIRINTPELKSTPYSVLKEGEHNLKDIINVNGRTIVDIWKSKPRIVNTNIQSVHHPLTEKENYLRASGQSIELGKEMKKGLIEKIDDININVNTVEGKIEAYRQVNSILRKYGRSLNNNIEGSIKIPLNRRDFELEYETEKAMFMNVKGENSDQKFLSNIIDYLTNIDYENIDQTIIEKLDSYCEMTQNIITMSCIVLDYKTECEVASDTIGKGVNLNQEKVEVMCNQLLEQYAFFRGLFGKGVKLDYTTMELVDEFKKTFNNLKVRNYFLEIPKVEPSSYEKLYEGGPLLKNSISKFLVKRELESINVPETKINEVLKIIEKDPNIGKIQFQKAGEQGLSKYIKLKDNYIKLYDIEYSVNTIDEGSKIVNNTVENILGNNKVHNENLPDIQYYHDNVVENMVNNAGDKMIKEEYETFVNSCSPMVNYVVEPNLITSITIYLNNPKVIEMFFMLSSCF